MYIAIVLILVFCCNSCSESENFKTLRLGHGLDVSHSVHKAMVKMGEDIEALSDGRLILEIYPSQPLGTEYQSLELL